MNLKSLSPRRLFKLARTVTEGRPKCLALVRSIVRDKKGIEIGGPSRVLRAFYYLPIYEFIGSLDNCDFSRATVWAPYEENFRFSKHKPPGKTYISEGSDLHEIADNGYDFILSSHSLEHVANPIRALKEWQRIVKPGGHLILVLPDYSRTFDCLRKPTPVEHMIADYERHTGEDDLTHVHEVIANRDRQEDPADDDTFRALLLDNFSNRRMHHHVFDPTNSKQLLEAAGMKVLAVETHLPFHIFLVAQMP